MESNKDEALRALAIAQRHRDSGNFASARRFAEKSLKLFDTPEARKLLSAVDREEATSSAGSEAGPSTSASGTETHPTSGGTRHRHAPSSSNSSAKPDEKPREYTTENEKVVKRVRSSKPTDYYGILGLQRDCEENDVKKAYRKLALQLHPDKNGAPGADEAFKLVSKAFQVLSDSSKRAAYDRHGDDPDSRFSGMSSSAASSFARSPGGGMAFEGEISPEELFNMFFGGGMGGSSPFGGGFGGGPGVFTASFGPGGFRTTRMGGEGGARRQGGQETQSSMLVQLLPLIILVAFSLLNALPSLLSGPSYPDPIYTFTPTSSYGTERLTSNLGIKYYVNEAQLNSHPVIGVELSQATSGQGTKSGKAMRQFEQVVEQKYTSQLYNACRRATDRKERRREQEIGFMGLGTNWEKVRSIERELVPECDELRRLGVL